MSMTYGFQVRFLMPKDDGISHEGEVLEIHLPPNGKEVCLKPVFSGKISGADYLSIRGAGFASEEEAYSVGRRLKQALLVCSAMLRIGFDVGKDEERSGWGQFLIDQAEELGFRVVNDVHGLSIYPEDLPLRFPAARGHLSGGMDSAYFVNGLIRAYEEDYKISDKQSLALEIYNLSHFEISQRARFLTLVSAVESLSSRSERSPQSIEHLKHLINFTESSGLSEGDKESLIRGLGNLKVESISRSTRYLVKHYLGKEAMQFFYSCYEVRSRVLHVGSVPEGADINTLVSKLDELVSKLLIAVLQAGKTGGKK